jgi:hypothetical protein
VEPPHGPSGLRPVTLDETPAAFSPAKNTTFIATLAKNVPLLRAMKRTYIVPAT